MREKGFYHHTNIAKRERMWMDLRANRGEFLRKKEAFSGELNGLMDVKEELEGELLEVESKMEELVMDYLVKVKANNDIQDAIMSRVSGSRE